MWIKNREAIHLGCDEGDGLENFIPLEFPYTVLLNRITGRTIVIPIHPISAQERSNKRLFRKINSFILAGNKFKAFWTLTFDDPHFDTFEGNGSIVRKFLNKIQMFQRSHGRPKISYVWKYEEGEKSYRPHFHLMVTGWVPIAQVIRAWGQGNVELKAITDVRMARNYIGKYITKSNKDPIYWMGGKRFSSSRDIPKCPESDWKRVGWSKEPLDLTKEYDFRGDLPKYY